MRSNIKQCLNKTQLSHLDAELLLAFVIYKSREYVIMHPEHTLSWRQAHRFSRLVKKRLSGIPLSHLTGRKAFMGLDFLVTQETLVPRPDTEILVARALELLPKDEQGTVIDVGTGSGCIPIAIAVHADTSSQIFATDISKRALKVAKKNAALHNIDITFLKGNLIDPILQDSIFNIQTSPLILTANLPYLTHAQFEAEHSIQHEPYSALVADEDGLALIRELLEQIRMVEQKIPSRTHLLLEYDPDQTAALQTLAHDILPGWTATIHKDLAGHDRIFELSQTDTTAR